MIGGHDILITTRAGLAGLDACVRTILRRWPQAVFDDGTGNSLIRRYADIAFSQSQELFVYRDEKASDTWEQLGAAPETENSMIHLVLGTSGITVVVDDPTTSEMAAIIAEITHTLYNHILNATWQRSAA